MIPCNQTKLHTNTQNGNCLAGCLASILEVPISEIPDGNKFEVIRGARQKARIKCRELSAVLGLKISQISDIEHGRVEVSDDVLTAWFMVCGSKLVVQHEMANKPIQPAQERAVPVKGEECKGFARGGTHQCCDRAGEYNGFGSDGPSLFQCPESCPCHD